MKPEKFLKMTEKMATQLKSLKGSAVFVGLPKEKVGGKVYGDGSTIISVGASHEYGAKYLPKRSFLRAPFLIKKNEINKSIANQYKLVQEGKINPDIALGRIGAIAVNYSKGAFTSLGYGEWKPIKLETAKRKGSSQTLIDTGVLRSSISWVIRNAT